MSGPPDIVQRFQSVQPDDVCGCRCSAGRGTACRLQLLAAEEGRFRHRAALGRSRRRGPSATNTVPR
jgi:hypothetical protein